MNFSKQENANTIGVYDRKCVKVFIHCATDTIVDHSFDFQHDGHWFLYCLTKNGGLYRVEKSIEERLVRQSGSNEYDQTEIFSDLLGRPDDADVFQLRMSTQPVYILNDSDIIGKKFENPVVLCVCSNQIVIVTETAIEYIIRLYGKANMFADEAIAKLPKNIKIERKAKYSKTLLVKVVTCDCISSCDPTSSDVLKLDAALFKKLFGEETILLNSPILLIGQVDGSVHFIPMSSFVSSSNLESMPMSLKSNSSKDSLNLLCQMSHSVMEITNVTLVKDDGQTSDLRDTALCICGQDGQVVIFWSKNGNPDYIVSEVFICSPVLSVGSFRNKIYHCNGYSLFESLVEVHTRDGNIQGNRQLQISKTKVLNNKHVTEIHAVSAEELVQSQASQCSIYCSCLNGQLTVIETSGWSDLNSDTRMSKKETLKDILTSIDEVGKTRQQVKGRSAAQEENLKQLGTAAYLMALYVHQKNERLSDEGENIDGRGLEEIIHLSPKVLISVVHQPKAQLKHENDCFEMSVEITNQMAVTLSSDWTVTASVVSADASDEIATASVKVNKEWKEKEKMVLQLSVSFQQILSTCKLIVKAAVMMGNIVRTQDDKRDGTNRGHISIPIYEKDIDVIDCLLPVSETNLVNKDVSTCTSKTIAMMKEQAENRISKWKLSNTNEDSGDITVCTRNVFHLSSAFGGDGQERAASDLLKVLLGKTIPDSNDINPNDCQLMTALGHAVHLSVLPVKSDRSSGHDSGDTLNRRTETFEVIVRASPRIAAALHRAISCREQQIIRKMGKRFEPTISMQCARKSIQTAQDTMKHLNSNVQNETTLAFAYQKIRNIPL